MTAAVIHFGGLVCVYLANQDLSRSERQQTVKTCVGGVFYQAFWGCCTPVA